MRKSILILSVFLAYGCTVIVALPEQGPARPIKNENAAPKLFKYVEGINPRCPSGYKKVVDNAPNPRGSVVTIERRREKGIFCATQNVQAISRYLNPTGIKVG